MAKFAVFNTSSHRWVTISNYRPRKGRRRYHRHDGCFPHRNFRSKPLDCSHKPTNPSLFGGLQLQISINAAAIILPSPFIHISNQNGQQKSRQNHRRRPSCHCNCDRLRNWTWQKEERDDKATLRIAGFWLECILWETSRWDG